MPSPPRPFPLNLIPISSPPSRPISPPSSRRSSASSSNSSSDHLELTPPTTSRRLPKSPSPPRPSSPTYQDDLDDDDDRPGSLNSPLLGNTAGVSSARKVSVSWSRRRRRPSAGSVIRGWRRGFLAIVRHPLFPTQPTTILLSLLLFLAFALSLTLLLMHILNPDKSPLPWQDYCLNTPSFPPSHFSSLPPVGVFVGVFSMDASVERRMLVRSTWASHKRSRAGDGSGRTVVRFILGKPRKEWERRVKLEMETYNDIVILPIPENMNTGKSHAYFTWAHTSAFVPPPPSSFPSTSYPFAHSFDPYGSTSNTSPAPHILAPHDPLPYNTYTSHANSNWTRPEYIVKADDDSFVMLAELEGRLRVEWFDSIYSSPDEIPVPSHMASSTSTAKGGAPTSPALWTTPGLLGAGYNKYGYRPFQQDATSSSSSVSTTTKDVLKPTDVTRPVPPLASKGPLVYWGYLVKSRFMAGELYALSSPLVHYAATYEPLKAMVRGAEDKQTAKWMGVHPRKNDILWRSERCWIYDHPRSGTVYSHGFLFPSLIPHLPFPLGSMSTVSRFGQRYTPPSDNLTTEQEVEALIEGSSLSLLSSSSSSSSSTSPSNQSPSINSLGGGGDGEITEKDIETAWLKREGRKERYLNREDEIGGTVVVHFIKRNEWYLETALALLGGEDEVRHVPTAAEKAKEKADKEMIVGGKGGMTKGNGKGRVRPGIDFGLSNGASRPALEILAPGESDEVEQGGTEEVVEDGGDDDDEEEEEEEKPVEEEKFSEEETVVPPEETVVEGGDLEEESEEPENENDLEEELTEEEQTSEEPEPAEEDIEFPSPDTPAPDVDVESSEPPPPALEDSNLDNW